VILIGDKDDYTQITETSVLLGDSVCQVGG